jgi:hypothetical protein
MESSIAAPYRLKVRLGGHEFEAEGPESTVKEQFQIFATYAGSLSPMAAAQMNGGKPVGEVTTAEDGIDEKWARAYKVGKDEVSLHVLPQTKTANADAFVPYRQAVCG